MDNDQNNSMSTQAASNTRSDPVVHNIGPVLQTSGQANQESSISINDMTYTSHAHSKQARRGRIVAASGTLGLPHQHDSTLPADDATRQIWVCRFMEAMKDVSRTQDGLSEFTKGRIAKLFKTQEQRVRTEESCWTLLRKVEKLSSLNNAGQGSFANKCHEVIEAMRSQKTICLDLTALNSVQAFVENPGLVARHKQHFSASNGARSKKNSRNAATHKLVVQVLSTDSAAGGDSENSLKRKLDVVLRDADGEAATHRVKPRVQKSQKVTTSETDTSTLEKDTSSTMQAPKTDAIDEVPNVASNSRSLDHVTLHSATSSYQQLSRRLESVSPSPALRMDTAANGHQRTPASSSMVHRALFGPDSQASQNMSGQQQDYYPASTGDVGPGRQDAEDIIFGEDIEYQRWVYATFGGIGSSS